MRVGLTTSIATAIAIGVLIASGGSNASGCPLPAYPDASCTGVPAGTSLTTYTGPTTITTNDTVIDSKQINGCLIIQASNVLIKNSKIVYSGGSCDALVWLDDGPGWNNYSVTVQDSEIDCGGDPPGGYNGSTAFAQAFITVLRDNIHGCENGFDANQSVDIRDSYIHDLRQCTVADGCQGPDGSHTDGLQFTLGHYNPPGTANIDDGSLNVTIVHNTWLSMKSGAGTPEADASFYTTSAIISNGTSIDTNIIIDNNLFAGGAYTLYCEQNGATYQGTSHVNNNHFSTRYKSTVGYYGPTVDCTNENWSGNVYDETGLPVDGG